MKGVVDRVVAPEEEAEEIFGWLNLGLLCIYLDMQ